MAHRCALLTSLAQRQLGCSRNSSTVNLYMCSQVADCHAVALLLLLQCQRCFYPPPPPPQGSPGAASTPSASLEPAAGPPLEELRLALQEHAEAAGWAHTHAWLARGGSGTAAAGEH